MRKERLKTSTRAAVTVLEEIDARFCVKVTHIIGQVGQDGLDQMGQTHPSLHAQTYAALQTGKDPGSRCGDRITFGPAAIK